MCLQFMMKQLDAFWTRYWCSVINIYLWNRKYYWNWFHIWIFADMKPIPIYVLYADLGVRPTRPIVPAPTCRLSSSLYLSHWCWQWWQLQWHGLSLCVSFFRYGVCSCPSPLVIQGNVCVEKEEQVWESMFLLTSIHQPSPSHHLTNGKLPCDYHHLIAINHDHHRSQPGLCSAARDCHESADCLYNREGGYYRWWWRKFMFVVVKELLFVY